MKLFLIFILTFSILADFTSASVIEIDSSSICESSLSCADVDLHQETNSEHKEENHNHHCHCHTGHAHTAIAYKVFSSFKAVEFKLSLKYPPFKQGDLQNFNSNIKRPPIS